MTSQNPSRRMLIVSASALAGASSLPQIATGPVLPIGFDDPIFASIDNHRKALLHRFEACAAAVCLRDHTPEFDAANVVNDAAVDAEIAAQDDLISTVPTTMDGAIALLNYADDLCAQKVTLPLDPRNLHSDVESLMDFSGGIVSVFDGEPLQLPFLFWVVRSARLSLQRLAVKS